MNPYGTGSALQGDQPMTGPGQNTYLKSRSRTTCFLSDRIWSLVPVISGTWGEHGALGCWIRGALCIIVNRSHDRGMIIRVGFVTFSPKSTWLKRNDAHFSRIMGSYQSTSRFLMYCPKYGHSSTRTWGGNKGAIKTGLEIRSAPTMVPNRRGSLMRGPQTQATNGSRGTVSSSRWRHQ
ncbi:hypothetical protein XENTR_v10007598 [Xenopus tropicalis]|nr:hypothetical protein XENTR_v10007598 [Xenopus tropicalis]